MITFTSTLRVNCFFWFSSLRPGEEGTTRRVTEDLFPYLNSIGLQHQYWSPATSDALDQALDAIAEAGTEGMCPIVHFDMHGSERSGLLIAASGEHFSWDRLYNKLRRINITTANNLCVISTCCFGFHMIKSLRITEACPFYMLIAPEREITLGFIEDSVFKFYRDVFLQGGIIEYYERYLSNSMKIFHSEKVLAIVLSRYIGESCIGKGGAERRERLLTDVLASGVPGNRSNKRLIRKSLKGLLQPSQALVDRFVETFLLGKQVGFNIDDLTSFAVRAKKGASRS